MFIQLTIFLCTLQILTEECKCIKFMDLPSDSGESDVTEPYVTHAPDKAFSERKYLLEHIGHFPSSSTFKQVKDNINRLKIISRRMRKQYKTNPDIQRDRDVFKQKIGTLTEQCILDSNRTMHSIDSIRNPIKHNAPYQIGFITRFIKHQRDLMNDLFDMAVKYRENVVILQHMNVFEHILHTSVNITNLVNRLVAVHVKYKNSQKHPPASPLLPPPASKPNVTTDGTRRWTGKEDNQYEKKNGKFQSWKLR